jgi:hypothetical protein
MKGGGKSFWSVADSLDFFVQVAKFATCLWSQIKLESNNPQIFMELVHATKKSVKPRGITVNPFHAKI